MFDERATDHLYEIKVKSVGYLDRQEHYMYLVDARLVKEVLSDEGMFFYVLTCKGRNILKRLLR